METIIGIDLGTTNSEVAAMIDGRLEVIASGHSNMLPSCVGLDDAGKLLVGAPAKNQHSLHPDRTILAVKRRMGQAEPIPLGDRTYSPQEISSFILRELVSWASARLGVTPEKAVITVPAYFSDAQRQATREAGALAGLEVLRIINEPTAASLAYEGEGGNGTLLVYDLGGGTFDVSIVRRESDVTEVLASHGNNHLGGDDFTALLFERLADDFNEVSGVDVRSGEAQARARLWWAAEEAKKLLSEQPFATIREEALLLRDGKPVHFEREVSREEYEELISDLVESTMESVAKALKDAGISAGELDGILLVGGSSRTPLIQDLLRSRSDAPLHQEVHPDLCVALGAGRLAARLGGHAIRQTLVDITAYSYGISFLGELDGEEYPYCYKPIISRNSPLPLTRTERYFTAFPGQTGARIEIYQGESPDALQNIRLGEFVIEGLKPSDENATILCKMRLDLDGILQVSATEKETGLAASIRIEKQQTPMTEPEIHSARTKLSRLFADRGDIPEEMVLEAQANGDPEGTNGASAAESLAANQLLEKSRSLLDRMHADDRDEAIELHERITNALQDGDLSELEAAMEELREIVFFVEGK
ncbi:MAG: Hsp70 family protein [Planctomycetota bacterium]